MTARQATIRRTRPRTITRRQETLFALILALLGFLFTAMLLANFDAFRFAFAEWGEEPAPVAEEPFD
ncbi:MAG: hypothetical protein AB1689_23475 [Thermodesulfobacteriota bacterium]